MQMYDGQQRQQQLMNGVNQIPQMMHMQNPLPPQPPGGMYPYGLEHMDQQQQHQIPKLEQQWESHLLMDDKHVVRFIYLFCILTYFCELV